MLKTEFDSINHIYRIDDAEVPSVTQVIDPLIDYSMVPVDVLEYKRWIGKSVHECIRLYNITGELPPDYHPDLEPYLEGYMKFRALADWSPKIVETPMFSKRFGFAGTPDEAGLYEDRPALIDTKTVAHICDAVGLQLGGYRKLLSEYDSTYENADRYALQLNGRGSFKLVPFEDAADWPVFLSMLQIHRWRTKSGVKFLNVS